MQEAEEVEYEQDNCPTIHTSTHRHAHTQTSTHTDTHTHRHAPTHTRTHTQTRTHSHYFVAALCLIELIRAQDIQEHSSIKERKPRLTHSPLKHTGRNLGSGES